MHRITIISLLFFICRIAPAQIEKEVDSVLSKRDFAAFKKYADSLTNREKEISGHWEYLRDIAPGFMEGVFLFNQMRKDTNSGRNYMNIYWVTIITTDKQVIFYELVYGYTNDRGKRPGEYYRMIDQFKDDSAYTAFGNSFKQVFSVELNDSDLFNTGIIYGRACGFGGGKPAEKEEVDKFITEKNKAELLKWLQSANTEKQVYAVEGFYELNKLGIKPTAKELQMIKFVMNKKGEIKTCSGCFGGREQIKTMVSDFKF